MRIEYAVEASGERIILTDVVLECFIRQRQKYFWQSETGGQIFARFKSRSVVIERVTVLKNLEKHSRFSYVNSRKEAQAEIEILYKRGLNYIGDWHTHPQKYPHPSRQDEITMASRVQQSVHDLNGFIFIIVGTKAFPYGLNVMFHNGERATSLEANCTLA